MLFPYWSSSASSASQHNYDIVEGAVGLIKVIDKEVAIKYQASPTGGGTVDPAEETVKGDADATGSTATANPGYKFINWTNSADTEVGTDAAFKPARVADGKYETATYTATFTATPIPKPVSSDDDDDDDADNADDADDDDDADNPVATADGVVLRKHDDGR